MSVTVRIPAGWTRTEGGSSALFTSGFDSVAVDTLSTPQAPTTASARTFDVPELQTTSNGFVLGQIATAARPAGTAVLVTYEALSPLATSSQPVVEAVERYQFWRGTHEAILTLSSPAGTANAGAWRTITDSLRWLS
ncbi:hypothetical protein LWP59_13355 [Amycolatopsis acidiphila]|uniref:DUF1795 domain-containing protein n=1 Tax=Amycolatopsis acidiphila TaxID=715473 RepID=A0A558AJ81_9PSEU|nr:hypothetical protein [Amycolatopsis acidiphila]TVT24324.1 hypothetical protein FNH06_07100 [Amycolatopsis acidiphila]UIJ62542.1 hypothetical protein LWP59_13355 [Amycolatopsis acidiphila]